MPKRREEKSSNVSFVRSFLNFFLSFFSTLAFIILCSPRIFSSAILLAASTPAIAGEERREADRDEEEEEEEEKMEEKGGRTNGVGRGTGGGRGRRANNEEREDADDEAAEEKEEKGTEAKADAGGLLKAAAPLPAPPDEERTEVFTADAAEEGTERGERNEGEENWGREEQRSWKRKRMQKRKAIQLLLHSLWLKMHSNLLQQERCKKKCDPANQRIQSNQKWKEEEKETEWNH